jgi:hypothetical protein
MIPMLTSKQLAHNDPSKFEGGKIGTLTETGERNEQYIV